MLKVALGYALIINMIGFTFMYMDKQKAIKGEYRIPEATLWRISVIGGAIGTTAGMHVFHHKTRKAAFQFGFPALALLDAVLILYIIF